MNARRRAKDLTDRPTFTERFNGVADAEKILSGPVELIPAHKRCINAALTSLAQHSSLGQERAASEAKATTPMTPAEEEYAAQRLFGSTPDYTIYFLPGLSVFVAVLLSNVLPSIFAGRNATQEEWTSGLLLGAVALIFGFMLVRGTVAKEYVKDCSTVALAIWDQRHSAGGDPSAENVDHHASTAESARQWPRKFMRR